MTGPAARRARIQAALVESGAEGFLSEAPVDIRYLTGCGDVGGYLLLPTAGDALLLTSAHDGPQARAEAVATEVAIWRPGEEPLELLVEAVSGRARRLVAPGLDGCALDALRGAGIAVNLVPAFAAGRRRVKESGELELIRRAARIVEAGMAAARDALGVGVREIEVAAAAERAMRVLGADGRVFETKVESGPRSAWPSTYASERAIEAGDLVLIDMGPTYRGYYGDLTRTFVVGEPSAAQRALLELALAAQGAALATIRPGITGHTVDEAARRVLREAGRVEHFLHHTGHALGLAGDGLVLLAPNAAEPLLAGECVTVEPGLYVEGVGGVRIEDEVLITEDGIELLTDCPKSVEGLIVPAERRGPATRDGGPDA